MNRARWQRVEALFHRAVELPSQARAELLELECAGDDGLQRKVERLLVADEGASDLIDQWDERGPLSSPDAMVGRQVGAYRLISRVAMGGMGVVYRAERSDGLFDHEVAVKLIRTERATSGMIQRFELERRTLAALSHPNIARLHDGGTTDEGLPYFVMELVHGAPIDQYCNAGRLGIEERLRLFVRVCRAVQFAHSNLVVHRDLKPGNILVDRQSVPKLLDFGIARLVDEGAVEGTVEGAAATTQTVARILTPEYASPEQLSGGPITTAIDVYSLGVVLYVLLTGEKPLHFESRTPADWRRVLIEHTPTRPSTAVVRPPAGAESEDEPATTPQFRAARFGSTPGGLRRRLRGDLDRIILMALRKEPERRYASAKEFADDLERHLSGLPVLAREDSITYRATKFVQRNKLVVASAAVVLLALVLGFFAARRGELRAQREATHASIEADSFQGIAEFLMDTFLSATMADDGARLRAAHERVLLHAERVRRQYATEDHVRANLIEALGRVCLRVDMFEDADRLLREAMEIREQAFGERSLEYALSLRNVGLSHFRQGAFAEAERSLAQALELHRTCPVGVHTDVAGLANDLAACLRNLDRMEQSEALHREALELRRAQENGTLAVAESLNNLAGIHLQRGEHDTAAELLREALELRRAILGDQDPLTLQTTSNLASALWPLGRREEALLLLGEAERGFRSLRADGVEGLGRVLSNLAAIQIDAGEFEAAEANLAEALDLQQGRLGEAHPIVLAILTKIAILQHARGEDLEARKTWDRIVETQSSQATSERALGRTLYDYGVFLVDLQAHEEASMALLEAVFVLRDDAEVYPLELGRAELALGECLSEQRQRSEAEAHLLEAVSMLQRALPRAEPELQRARAALEALRSQAAAHVEAGG